MGTTNFFLSQPPPSWSFPAQPEAAAESSTQGGASSLSAQGAYHPLQPPPSWGFPAQLQAAESSTQARAGSSLAPNMPPAPEIMPSLVDNTFSSARATTASSSQYPLPSQLNPMPIMTANTLGSIDACANPRYSSHMPDVFTTQYAREQALHEEKRSRDEERIRNLKRAEQTVTVYAFYEVRGTLYALYYLLTCCDRMMWIHLWYNSRRASHGLSS
jgi:hypothetical protein